MCAIIPHSAISDAHPFRALQSKALPCHPPHAHSQCFQVPPCREVSPPKEHVCSLKVLAVSVVFWVGTDGGAYSTGMSWGVLIKNALILNTVCRC